MSALDRIRKLEQLLAKVQRNKGAKPAVSSASSSAAAAPSREQPRPVVPSPSAAAASAPSTATPTSRTTPGMPVSSPSRSPAQVVPSPVREPAPQRPAAVIPSPSREPAAPPAPAHVVPSPAAVGMRRSSPPMMKDEPKVIVDMAALTEPAPDTKKPKATPLEMALEVELDKPATPTPAVAAPRAEDAELDHRVTGRMAPHEPSRAREPSPPATPRARTIEPAGVGQPSRDVARVIAPAETPPARTFGQLLAGTLSLRPR